MLKRMLTLTGICLSACFSLFADTTGQDLETQMWNDIKHQNWSAVEKRIAPDFQSVHTFGTLNRAQEIELIKNLGIGSYTITDVQETNGGNTIIVTYKVAVSEKIDNKPLPNKPTVRLSVWQKINDTWQWIAHANLNPVPTTTTTKTTATTTAPATSTTTTPSKAK